MAELWLHSQLPIRLDEEKRYTVGELFEKFEQLVRTVEQQAAQIKQLQETLGYLPDGDIYQTAKDQAQSGAAQK